MAVTILTRRSDTPSKRPDPDVIFNGELALNFDAATGGLYYKDTDDNIVKVGPCQVSPTAPNSTPPLGGSAGNSLGEFWFDSVSNSLFVWNGTIWVDTTLGIAVQSVSGTSPIEIDNTDPLNPIVGVDAATTSALGVVQVGTNLNVAAGTISVPAATTAAQGAVRVGTNIDVASGTISVANSSTTAKGVVQLNDTTNNSSTDLALTAAQGKNLQDQIDALVITSNLTFAGIFDTTVGPNGVMTTVSAAAAGLAVPFVVGDPLPAPAAENAEFFVIVAGAIGVYGPTTVPASAPPYHVGDWFLSDGTNWEFLNVGFQAPAATTAVEGVVYLATDLEVQTGTDTSNKAVNPASLQAKVSDSTSTTSSTTIASSTAVKAAYDAGVAAQGTADQAVLDAAAAQGDADQALLDAAAAQGTADAALPKAGGTMTGTLNTLNVCLGTGTSITFNGGASGAIRGISDATGNTNDDIAASSTAVKNAYNLADAAVPKSCYTALGALAAGTGASTVGTLALGTNGQVLSANSACVLGLEWVAAGGGGGSPATPTVAGIVYGCSAADNVSVGQYALQSITSGSNNVAVGCEALCSVTTGISNVAVGQSLVSNTGDQNTAVGSGALFLNTTGGLNTALGNNTMVFNATGCCNTGIGQGALYCNSAGNCNVALGIGSGFGATGSNNIFLGACSLPSAAGVNNEVDIYNGSVTARFQGAAVGWSFVSDVRDKRNVTALPVGLEFVNDLQPRQFEWDIRDSEVDQGKAASGFIAQEVDAAVESHSAEYLGLVDKNNPEQFTLTQTNLIPVMVKAIQELSAELNVLKAEIKELKSNS